MKSIDEFATEYAQDKYMPVQTSQAVKAGANYVLDILEKELPLEDNRNLNDYGKALVWRLKNCIEQLKK